MVDSNFFRASDELIASPARLWTPLMADMTMLPARFAIAPFRTVKPPSALRALSPASSTALPSFSLESDDFPICDSRSLMSAFVLLMSVCALFICVRIRDMERSFWSLASVDFSTCSFRFATTSACCLYSVEDVPSSRPMRSSSDFSLLYEATSCSCFSLFCWYSLPIFSYCSRSTDSFDFCSSSRWVSAVCLAVSASMLVSFLSYCEDTSLSSDETSFRFCEMLRNAARYSDSPVSLTAPPKLAIESPPV